MKLIIRIINFFVIILNKLRWFVLKIINNRDKKRIIIILLFLGFVTILIGLLIFKNILSKNKQRQEESNIVKVKVEQIKKTNKSLTYPIMGTIKGTIETELRFEVEGIIQKYNYKEGEKIVKGVIIAYLDPKDAMARVQYARSKYESEKSVYFSTLQKLKVHEELYRLKAISESKLMEIKYEVDSLKQRVDTALAELELAQSNLAKTNLKAPYTGILAEIYIKAGEFVTPNDVVGKFVSISDAYCEVEVPEKDVMQIKPLMKAVLTCDAYPSKQFEGSVAEVAPIVKEKTRTVVVKIGIPNSDGLLRSGMFARGEIQIKEITDAILVLKDSIVSLKEDVKLLPILKPIPDKPNLGIVELRQVSVGETIDKYVIIVDGVNEGEYYITETSGELSDGITVEYSIPSVEEIPTPSIN
ncbi:MAG: efflux RND transporter periplasmic adaptor subunit [Nitrososphaeria archaeon]